MTEIVKPSLEKRRKLVIAGMTTHDALDVMNEFYWFAETDSRDISDPYWSTMLAVLCERVVRSEKWLEELRCELAVMHSLRHTGCEKCDWELADTMDEAVCRVCGKTDSIDILSMPEESR